MSRTPGSRSTKRSSHNEGKARCWRVMGYLSANAGGFTVVQVVMTANVTPNTARHYIKALERSGHVQKVAKCMSGHAGSWDTWRVVRYTGDDAPILHRNRTGVTDPNTGETWDFTKKENKEVPHAG